MPFTFTHGSARFPGPLELGEHAEPEDRCAFTKDGREIKIGSLKSEAFEIPSQTFAVKCYCRSHGCNGHYITVQDQASLVKSFLECNVLKRLVDLMKEGAIKGPSIFQLKNFFDRMNVAPPPLPNWPTTTETTTTSTTTATTTTTSTEAITKETEQDERDYTTIAIIVAFLVVFLITLTIPVIRTIQKRRHKAWLARTWDQRLKQAEDDLRSKQTLWFKPKSIALPSRVTSVTSSGTSSAGGTTKPTGTTKQTTSVATDSTAPTSTRK